MKLTSKCGWREQIPSTIATEKIYCINTTLDARSVLAGRLKLNEKTAQPIGLNHWLPERPESIRINLKNKNKINNC